MPQAASERESLRVPWEQQRKEITGEEREFPKYTTQLLNIANQNAQGTRPAVVGQMSELIQDCPEQTYDGWKDWYTETHPDAIEEATDRVEAMIEKMRQAMEQIDRDMIWEWVEDLVIDKTAEGLIIQEIVLTEVADKAGADYTLAGPEDESKNIDGYIGDQPISVKPEKYKSKDSSVRETIQVPIIYYKKTAKYLHVHYPPELVTG